MTNPTGYTALDLVGYTDKGDYSSSETYVKNDLANYNGIKWRCLIDDTTDVTPAEGLNWTKFIEYGDYVKEVDYEEDIYGVETPNPQSIQHQLTDQTNVLGAKNLIPYPYSDGDAKTKNGITFTCDTDGVVTANGTATEMADYIFTNKLVYSSLVKLKNGGSYTLSGCPNNGSAQSYCLYAQIVKNNIDTWYTLVTDYGSGANVEIPNDSNVYYAHIYMHIKSGQTVTNLTFKPMLRLASDPDNTYVPYAMTNRELTEKKINLSDLKTIVSSSSDFAAFKTAIANL